MVGADPVRGSGVAVVRLCLYGLGIVEGKRETGGRVRRGNESG